MKTRHAMLVLVSASFPEVLGGCGGGDGAGASPGGTASAAGASGSRADSGSGENVGGATGGGSSEGGFADTGGRDGLGGADAAAGAGGGFAGSGGSAGATDTAAGAGGASAGAGGAVGSGGNGALSTGGMGAAGASGDDAGAAGWGGATGMAGSAGLAAAAGVAGFGDAAGAAGASAGSGGIFHGPGGDSCAAMNGTECNGEDCCTSIALPAGSYLMGRGSETCTGCTEGCPEGLECYFLEKPEVPTSLDAFEMDKYEVTVGRFRAFVDGYEQGWRPAMGQGANPAAEAAQGLYSGATGWQSDWDGELPDGGYGTSGDTLENAVTCQPGYDTWTAAPGENEQYPINCLTWYEAFAFCIWDGGRLPTEAEWEYVAAGGDENRVYPWGNDVTEPLRANYVLTEASPFIDVGSHPTGDGRWGHADLSGSIFEWVFDRFWGTRYADLEDGCTNCVDLSDSIYHAMRGGSWHNDADYARAARRTNNTPISRSRNYGVRCVRTP